MMWYEIPGLSGYRINHRREVLSLKGEEPQVMKTRRTPHGDTVMLRRDGKYVNCQVHDLMVAAGLQLPKPIVPRSIHPEAARQCCDQGHEFTPENTMRRVCRGRVIRKCKHCHRDAVARCRAKKKVA